MTLGEWLYMSEDETAAVERGPCAECGEPISVEASECPHCGHHPAHEVYYGPVVTMMVGAVLTVFIITAIVGIPLMLAGMAWAIWVWRTADPHPIGEAHFEAES